MFIISTKVLESGSKEANEALELLLPTLVQYICKVYIVSSSYCCFQQLFRHFSLQSQKIFLFVSLKSHLLNPFCLTTNNTHRGEKQNCDCKCFM